MNVSTIAQTRYTTKVFDPSRKIPPAALAELETLLRYAPSSTNSQPWHFFIVGSEEGKDGVAKSTCGRYAFNEARVKSASHLIVLCSRSTLDDRHLQALLDRERADGRFATPEDAEGQRNGRGYFVDMHRFELRDAQHWMEKQVYLALGMLLMGAAALGIDACPMEGFDQKILGEQLDLRAKGLNSAVVVALGYRAEDDFNAKLPKSRLPLEAVITRI